MNGKNEDDDGKKGLKGIFGFLGAPKRQALSAEDEIKDFVADSDDLLDDEKRMIHEILDLGDMGRGRDHDAARGYVLVEGTETVRQAVDRMMGTAIRAFRCSKGISTASSAWSTIRTWCLPCSTAMAMTWRSTMLSSRCSCPSRRMCSPFWPKCKRNGNRWPSW